MNGPRLYSMAWRNLWRNRRRTLVTLSAVVFGIFLAIIFSGVTDSSLGEAVDFAARLGSGHVTLQHPDYFELPSTRRSIEHVGELERLARAEPGVTGVVTRVVGQVMLATAGQSQAAQLIAYDPRHEDTETLPLIKNVPEAERLRDASGPGIILGKALAENLNATIGRKVVYTLTDKRGEIVTGLGRVSGILKTDVHAIDGSLCLLPIDTVRGVLGYAPDESTFVAVFLGDHRRAEVVAEHLGAAVSARLGGKPGAQVAALTWSAVQPDLAAFIAMKKGGLVFMGFLMLLLTGAGIFNTLFVSVMERLREFGILTAIGFTPGRLFRLVMWESFWLALVGIVVGLVVTAWPYHWLDTVGLDLSKASNGQQIEVAGAAMSMVMHARIHPEHAVVILVVILAATMLSGVYPAWRAGRVSPVEAIKLV